jgi:hypothetical protein
MLRNSDGSLQLLTIVQRNLCNWQEVCSSFVDACNSCEVLDDKDYYG